MINFFTMKCGGAVAAQAGIDGAPDYYSAQSEHWIRDVPFQPGALTADAVRLVAETENGVRNLYFRNNPTTEYADPAVARAYGTPPEYVTDHIPHARTADDMRDCTDWLNAMAAGSSYYSRAR